MSNTSGEPENKKKSFIGIYILIGVVALIGFLFYHSIKKRSELADAAKLASKPVLQSVRVVKPSLSADTAVLLLPGSIRGYRETSLCARVNGYVKNWYVDIGDHVTEGQLLVELETPELDQQLLQARANLELARTSLERVNSVTIEGAVSIQQKADRDGAYKADLALVNQLEAQKSFKRVRAPFTGIITSRNIDVGSLINAGSSATNQLYSIAQINKLRIFVNVPQTFVTNIKPGSEAKIIVQELSDKAITGKVTRTAGALDPATRTLLVQVEFDNPTHTYLPGMYARVKFVIKRTTRPFVIPANTLVIGSNGPTVVTVTPQHKIAIKSVSISKDNGATIELADGLKGDELLVANPNLGLREGSTVSIIKN